MILNVENINNDPNFRNPIDQDASEEEVSKYLDLCRHKLDQLRKQDQFDPYFFLLFPNVVSSLSVSIISFAESPVAQAYKLHNQYVREALARLLNPRLAGVKHAIILELSQPENQLHLQQIIYLLEKAADDIQAPGIGNKDSSIYQLATLKRSAEYSNEGKSPILDQSIVAPLVEALRSRSDGLVVGYAKWVLAMELVAYQVYSELSFDLGLAPVSFEQYISNVPKELNQAQENIFFIFAGFNRNNSRNLWVYMTYFYHGIQHLRLSQKGDFTRLLSQPLKVHFADFIAKCGATNILLSEGFDLLCEIMQHEGVFVS